MGPALRSTCVALGLGLACTAFIAGGCGDDDVFTKAGEANNVVLTSGFAHASVGPAGWIVLDPTDGRTIAAISPASPADSVDDIATDGTLLFALDAREPAHLSVYDISTPSTPTLLGSPREVAVGEFAGVAAANGIVVVSGGTAEMSVFSYDTAGLGTESSTLDFCRGLPDVVLAADGATAFASCHYVDTLEDGMFGMTSLSVAAPPAPITPLFELRIPGAGFTGGTARPANFPIESALDGDHLWVAHGGGLEGINVSDPRAMATVSRSAAGIMANSVAVLDGRAYIVGLEPNPTLQVWNVSNPAAPVEVESMALADASEPRGVAVDANWIAIAGGPAGVTFIAR